jgi:predicted Ser/Thr protein kinase
MVPLRPGDPANLGPYEIVGLLGEGGQGTVFLGRRDGTDVAVKLLHARFAGDSEARGRFVRELEVAKRVARFCTAQVLDADLDGDRPYIVSEYVTGRSLQDLVTDDGPRIGGALERLAIGTLTALAAIHQAGIVHRDFKPHNVLLGPDGPRVIDFGIARALDTTSQSQNVGTPSYMSPEQLAGSPLTPASDMFAWASTMVFAATGQPPFGNDELGAVLYRIAHGEPAVGALPHPLGEVITACLQKDPALRPTAADAQAMLLGGTAALAVPVLAPEEPVGDGPGHVGPENPGHEYSMQPPPEAQRVAGMTTHDPIQAYRPGPVKPRKTRNVVVACAAAAAVLLLSGAGWAMLRDSSDKTDAAGTVQAGTVGKTGKPGEQPARKAGGSKLTNKPGTTPTTSASSGQPTADPSKPGKAGPAATPPGVTPSTGAPADPAPVPTPTPTATPTATPPPTQPPPPVGKNPYTAVQVCNTGGHGKGYYVQRSLAFPGGRAVLLYNASGFNCVVTLKTTQVGTKSTVSAMLTRQSDHVLKKDGGAYEYYAGPVFISAPKTCVKFSGGAAGGGSATSRWVNCG